MWKKNYNNLSAFATRAEQNQGTDNSSGLKKYILRILFRFFYVMTSQYIKGLSEYILRGQRSFLDLDNPLYGYEEHNSIIMAIS